MKNLSCILLLLCCFFWACRPADATEENAGESTDSLRTKAAQEIHSQKNGIPERWLRTDYDGLRIRETPDLEGKVLATLPLGTRVLALGERSPKIEAIVLRGESIRAPWEKARTPDGLEGWIFLGGCSIAPDASVLQLEKELYKLDLHACESIHAAIGRYTQAMRGKSHAIADQAVLPLWQFLDTLMYVYKMDWWQQADSLGNKDLENLMYNEMMQRYYQAKHQKDPRPKEKIIPSNPKAIARKRALEQCGIALDYTEGIVLPQLQPGILIAPLSPIVSDTMLHFLVQWEIEEHRWTEDASLLISPCELAERAIHWDHFLEENPDFVLKRVIREQNRGYTYLLLAGADNTGAFDHGTAGPDFREAWEWVLAQHANTATGETVQAYCKLLRASGWKRDAAVDAFLQPLDPYTPRSQ